MRKHKKVYMIIGLLLVALTLFVISQLLWIKYNGAPVPRPNASEEAHTLGSGPPLRYAILGDSTAVAQGGDYDQGYAVATATHLAKTHTVTWANYGVPGARAKDVLEMQLPKVLAFKPDVALIAAGANDVTHLTATADVRNTLEQSVRQLKASNSKLAIILTGSPDMGSVPRFPKPVKWLADKRTRSINATIEQLAAAEGATFAPIARETGALYRAHPELFASDKFHPTSKGYQPWIPVLIKALDSALAKD